jgi:ACS family hexuronate transporter-like MFS transporter
VYLALAVICMALWRYANWSTMGLTLPSDLFPHGVVATVTGLSSFAAGLTGAAFTFAVGALVDRFSCGLAFLIAGQSLSLRQSVMTTLSELYLRKLGSCPAPTKCLH